MELSTPAESIHKPICVDRTSAYKPQCYTAQHREERLQNTPSATITSRPRTTSDRPILTGRQHSPADKPAHTEEKTHQPISETAEKPRAYSAPAVRQTSTAALWLAALCGLAGGMAAVAVGGEGFSAADTVMGCAEGSFLSMFVSRLAYCAVFLGAEYLLGFFALGEWLLWIVPLLCGLGTGFSAAALFGEKGWGALLCPALLTVATTVAGAVRAERFSAQLLRVVSGSRTGIVLTDGSVRGYTAGYLGCLALAVLTAIIEAAIKVSLA